MKIQPDDEMEACVTDQFVIERTDTQMKTTGFHFEWGSENHAITDITFNEGWLSTAKKIRVTFELLF